MQIIIIERCDTTMKKTKKKIMKIAEGINDKKRGELLYGIIAIAEILPIGECQRILDYLEELYLS